MDKIMLYTPIIILLVSCLLLIAGGIYSTSAWKRNVLQLTNGGDLEVFDKNLEKLVIFEKTWVTFVTLLTVAAQIALIFRVFGL